MSDEVFRWVITGGVFVIALSFLIIAVAAIVTGLLMARLKQKVDPLLDAAKPIARDAQEIVASTKPAAIQIAKDAQEVAALVTTEARRYSELAKDVAVRAKAQVARIDGAVDETVEHVQEAGGAMKQAVLRPLRRVDGVLAGVRAGISTLYRNQRDSVRTATQDEELFI